jgi:hypothetical protein
LLDVMALGARAYSRWDCTSVRTDGFVSIPQHRHRTARLSAGFFISASCWTGGAHVPMSYGHIAKERHMRPISGFVVAALAVLALAGCSTTAANNTTYARPAASSGLQVPLN